MKKTAVVFIFALGVIFSAHGQTKNQDIIKLLEITNTRAQAAQMFEMMLPSLQSISPDVPAVFWDMFQSKLDLDGFVALFIPIYDKHFSHDEIRRLIQFYESPIGKKLLAVTPLITQDSYIAGEQWGQKVGQDVINELIKQGYL